MPSKRSQPDRSKFPLVRALVPVRDAFAVSGYGTAAVVRRQPDGRLCYAIFFLNLSGGGIETMVGEDDVDQARVDEILNMSLPLMPPSTDGTDELAARYVRCAWAWGNCGEGFATSARQHLKLLPPLLGKPNCSRGWIAQMYHHPELMSPELLNAIEMFIDLPTAGEPTPSHREVIVATFMDFAVPDAAAVRRRMESQPDDFQWERHDRKLGDVYHWIQPRVRHPEERVPHGMIALGDAADLVRAHAVTLSGASKMVMLMRELTDDQARLTHVDWRGAEDIGFEPPGAVRIMPDDNESWGNESDDGLIDDD